MATPVTTRFVAPLLACCLLAGTACASKSTVAPPVASRLDVPPPPPRVISVPPEPVAPVETTTADPPVERPPQRAARPAVRPDNNGPTRAGQTPDVEAPPPTDVPAERAAEPAPTTPLLRTPQTRDESESARRIRLVLDRATEMLDDQAKAETLSREARTQHDTARRFIDQSKQALLERNFVFASYLADKAETLARGLSR